MIKRTALATTALVAFNVAALAQTNVLGPGMTTGTAGVAATMAFLGSNPSRKALTICNGSATATVTFTTGTVTPVSLTTGFVLLTGNVAASCFTMGQIGNPSSGGVGAQINVIASTAGVPVTIFEYF